MSRATLARRRRRARRSRSGGSWRRVRDDQRGQAGGVEAIALGVLVFGAGILLVINGWAVVDARFTVSAAAREAARAAAESPSAATAWERAADAVRATAQGHGRDPDTIGLAGAGFADFRRCGVVTVTATYDVAALTVPWVGGLGHGYTVHSTASALIDPYRSGLDGGGCA